MGSGVVMFMSGANAACAVNHLQNGRPFGAAVSAAVAYWTFKQARRTS